MKHLFEYDQGHGGVSLCRRERSGRDPVAITKAQDPAEAVCPACVAVQQRRLKRGRKLDVAGR